MVVFMSILIAQMIDRTAFFTESFRLTPLTAIQIPLLSKKSLLNSKARTHLHPKTWSWFTTDFEEKSRCIPHMLQFLALLLNARKVNHCFKRALVHVHQMFQDYETNASVTSMKSSSYVI